MLMEIFEINAGNFREQANMALLLQVIEIQKENFIQGELEQSSFLLTVWSEQELLSLASKGSSFFVAVESDKLIGYFAISSLVDFLKQLDEAESHSFDASVLNNSKPWAYLYQIAIRRGYQRMGISKKIANELMRVRSGTSFVSDYLLSPIVNSGSEKLFEQMGFKKNGMMTLGEYRGFGVTTWQIVTLA